MDSREKDIQRLCEAVLNMASATDYNLNGADTSTCMLCHESVDYPNAEIKDIPHSLTCGYLIAKDLSTGISPITHDPTQDQNALCECGHPYYRHFDTYDNMSPVGCKYCDCYQFKPAKK